MKYSERLLVIVEKIALVSIAIATTIAICQQVKQSYVTGTVELSDLLLLFIYLEVFAMIGNYIDSGHLPIRMPMYMAIVSLSRDLILVMTDMDDWRITSISIAMLIISITVALIRWGQLRSTLK